MSDNKSTARTTELTKFSVVSTWSAHSAAAGRSKKTDSELLLTSEWKSLDCSEQVGQAAQHRFRRERQTVAAISNNHHIGGPTAVRTCSISSCRRLPLLVTSAPVARHDRIVYHRRLLK